MSPQAFDFEQPIVDLESQIEELDKRLVELDEAPESEDAAVDTAVAEAETEEAAGDETAAETEEPGEDNGEAAAEAPKPQPASERKLLEKERDELVHRLEEKRQEIYRDLTPWQRVQIARHFDRPHTLDYIEMLFSEWTEVHGDRFFAEDTAMVAGYGFFEGQPVAVVGQQKGHETKENVRRNFGMAHPEGYRKALRVMKTAARFRRPIIALIDTPGAFPGIGAEERGIAEAIAHNMKEMFPLEVPIVCVIIGEGASGGAIGIGVGDAVMMLENSWYTVISPEGCASILWRDAKFAPQAADALKLTADDLKRLKIIDDIVPEPLGGAHRDPEQAGEFLRKAIGKHLKRLQKLSTEELMRARFEKYRAIGEFLEE